MKRVLFAINKMNARASSGHGIFMKGVIETLLDNGHFIDIVLDGEQQDTFLSQYPINVYFPDKVERLSYGKHSNLFQFSDSFNFEKSLNFRTAITKALTNHIYDLIICNDTESAFVCYQMGLGKFAKLTSYAHECASINPELGEGVFKDCYYDLVENMMFFKDFTTLIQTEQNLTKLRKIKGEKIEFSNCYVQPYPLTDSTPVNTSERDGLLFIGRHEDRKNPAAYIKLLAGIKATYGVEVKAKVLTRSAHVKKFESDFASIGHTNYEIRADVVGLEKAEIIQSSKLAFMPYKNESFGIAVLEALRFMPTIVLDKFDWHYNFNTFSNLFKYSDKDLVDKAWDLYNNFVPDAELVQQEFDTYESDYNTALLGLLKDTPVTKSKTEPRNRLYKYLQAEKGHFRCLESYFRTENEKGLVYLTSDIETLYTGRGWFEVHQTNEYTFVGIPVDGKITLVKVTSTPKGNENLSGFFD